VGGVGGVGSTAVDPYRGGTEEHGRQTKKDTALLCPLRETATIEIKKLAFSSRI